MIAQPHSREFYLIPTLVVGISLGQQKPWGWRCGIGRLRLIVRIHDMQHDQQIIDSVELAPVGASWRGGKGLYREGSKCTGSQLGLHGSEQGLEGLPGQGQSHPEDDTNGMRPSGLALWGIA